MKNKINLFFYKMFVNGFDTGASSARVGISSGPEVSLSTAPEGSQIDRKEFNTLRSRLKTDFNDLKKKAKELQAEDKPAYNAFIQNITAKYLDLNNQVQNQQSISKDGYNKMMQNLPELKAKYEKEIEDQIECVKNKKLCKEKIQKAAKDTYDELINEYSGIKYFGKIQHKHLLYVLSAYLLRWENVNKKAVDNIKTNDVASTVLAELTNKSGGAFSDLEAIKEDVKTNVLDAWKAAETKDDNRAIYSDNEWDTKYEKTFEDWMKEHKGRMPKFFSFTDTGVKPREDIAYREEGNDDYWDWARKQAVKGKFAPMPDIDRGFGKRSPAQITAGINPEKLEANITFQNKVVKYVNELNLKGKATNIDFGNIQIPQDGSKAVITFKKRGTEVPGTITLDNNISNCALNLKHGDKTFTASVPSAQQDKVVSEIDGFYNKLPAEALAGAPAETMENPPKVDDLTVRETEGGAFAGLYLKGSNLPSELGQYKTYPIGPKMISTAIQALNFKYGETRLDKLELTAQNLKHGLNAMLIIALTGMSADFRDPKMKLVIMQCVGKMDEAKLTQLTDILLKDKKNKPTVQVTGTASMDGSGNEQLALERANAAESKLDPEIKKLFNIKKEAQVLGPGGKIIKNPQELTQAWTDVVKKWNDELKPQKPITKEELEKKVISGTGADAKEKAFIKVNFEDYRGIVLFIKPPEYTGDKTLQIAITSENAPALQQAAAPQATPPAAPAAPTGTTSTTPPART